MHNGVFSDKDGADKIYSNQKDAEKLYDEVNFLEEEVHDEQVYDDAEFPSKGSVFGFSVGGLSEIHSEEKTTIVVTIADLTKSTKKSPQI